MAIEQELLLREAVAYTDALNLEFQPRRPLYRIPKRRIFISHASDAFRFVEGFIVMMRKAGIDAFYDWESGFLTDEVSGSPFRDLKVRVAAAQVFIFLATEQSITSADCLRALHFAKLINRHVYAVDTCSGKRVFSLPDDEQCHQLSVEKKIIRGSTSYLVRVQDRRYERLWQTVKQASQL